MSNEPNPLNIIKEQFKKDNYAKKFGIVLDSLSERSVKMHMELTDEMNNLFARPHGGAIYALADAAFSVVGNNRNNLSVALDCSISYHASPDPGKILYVEGELVEQSRRIGTYLFNLYTQENGVNQRVATMKSVLYRTGKPISDDLPVK